MKMKLILLLLLVFQMSFSIAQVGEESGLKNPDQRRQLLTELKLNDLNVVEKCKITLKITVNEKGEVINTPIVIKSLTTTNNPELINEVIRIVIRDARFSVGEQQTFYFTVNIDDDKNT